MQEWLCNIETVFKYLKYPVVSMGIIKYCKVVTMETSYFKVKLRDMSASFGEVLPKYMRLNLYYSFIKTVQ